MSFEHYQSVMETLHLVSSSANAAKLAPDPREATQAMRNICFVPEGWEQYTYWHGQDRKTLKRINILLDAAARATRLLALASPKRWWATCRVYWSRRIDESNRLVYRATDDDIIVVGCRYHQDG